MTELQHSRQRLVWQCSREFSLASWDNNEPVLLHQYLQQLWKGSRVGNTLSGVDASRRRPVLLRLPVRAALHPAQHWLRCQVPSSPGAGCPSPHGRCATDALVLLGVCSGRINFYSIYLAWLLSAWVYHLPGIAALGIDVKADVSLMLLVFFASILVRMWGCP